MLNIDVEIDSIEKLQDYIDYVKKISLMKTDKSFQKFIQDKVMETVMRVSDERMNGGTTNDDAIILYKSNHKIREYDEGFVLYNNTTIPAIVKGVQNSIENYPNGEFSIALAFEYGVGIIGQETMNEKSWAYNIQGYYFGWYLPKEVTGTSGLQTAGYKGFEVYRYTAIEVSNNLKKWVEEYYSKEK